MTRSARPDPVACTNSLEAAAAVRCGPGRDAGDPRPRPAQGLRRRSRALDGVDLDRRAAARCSPCSAPTAPARPPWSRSSRATARPTPARSACSATTRRSASAPSASASASCSRRTGWTRPSTCARRSSSTAPPTRAPRPARRGARAGRPRPTAPTPAPPTLSGGQRRRLDLALGIAGDPELIFLDEPTTGFDPAARRQLVGADRRPARARQDDPADHALHGGGAARSPTASSCSRAAGSSPRARRTRSAARRPREAVVRRSRCRRRASASASAPPRPTRDLPPLLSAAAGARRGARGPDRHASDARGRLPRAHRGARMTAIAAPSPSDLPPARPLDRRPRADDAAQAARARLHVRVPADPDRALFSALNGNAQVALDGDGRPASRSSTRPRSASSASPPPATRA